MGAAGKTRSKTALIIGAGPAGLTAGHELLTRSDIKPVILEMSDHMGGLSRTMRYKGNRIDIGGHRFFSKSDRVMNWWMSMMPVESSTGKVQPIAYHNQKRTIRTDRVDRDPAAKDRVMLIRERKSRIYFRGKFFEYPVRLSADTVRKLGVAMTARIAASYLWAAANPIEPETTLEQFLINRFGRQLYLMFFKSYTEKVWGVPCSEISADWGAQRTRGLSLIKTLLHAFKESIPRGDDLYQAKTETSLIERFLYPKFGPGQLWEHVARTIGSNGGEILTGWSVNRLHVTGNQVTGVTATHSSGETRRFDSDYVFSTMPVKELIRSLDNETPPGIREISEGLQYRDFIMVGLLLDRLQVSGGPLKDNWIYIHEPDVLAGRMQIFNNWSPHMAADPSKLWIGLEYFCYQTDPIWSKSDEEIISLAKQEMESIGMFSGKNVLDGTVIRMPKTYPAYYGTYDRFEELRKYVDQFENLFLIGRNGMHKYNNQDHSMLTAMTAVDNIIEGRINKANIWAINTEAEYHESKDGVVESDQPPDKREAYDRPAEKRPRVRRS